MISVKRNVNLDGLTYQYCNDFILNYASINSSMQQIHINSLHESTSDFTVDGFGNVLYIGTETRGFNICVTANGIPTGATSLNFRIYKNGVYVSATGREVFTIFPGGVTNGICGIWSITLEENDTIGIWGGRDAGFVALSRFWFSITSM